MMFTRIGSIAVALTFGMLMSAGLASAQEVRQDFALYQVNGGTDSVVASGAVNARGVKNDIAETMNPDNGTLVLQTSFVFGRGTIFTTVNASYSGKTDERTCINTFQANGVYTITGGTGDFSRATGDGTSAVKAYSRASRKADGKCSTDPADQRQIVFSGTFRGDIDLAGRR